jgi:type VI secretion system protein
MAQPSFIDKFSTGRHHGDRNGLASVMRNVQAMLATKKGYGYFLEGFGLGGYAEKTSKAGLAEELGKEIEAELRQHEPRLQEVQVELRGRDNALWLHYELRAHLSGNPCRMRILFDTTTGQIRVEPKEGE